MDSPYTLVCEDPTAKQFLTEWLDGTRLPWPGPFSINVTVGGSSPFPTDERPVFHQTDTGIQGGGGEQLPTRLTWQWKPAVALIDPTRPAADVWFSDEAVEAMPDGERSFLLMVLVFLMRRMSWFHVHGAALVDPQGRGWLIAGNSHCGKSTTTALMAANGWQVCTDDIAFVTMREGRVLLLGARARIALRAGGNAMLAATGGVDLGARNKQGYWPEELGAAWVGEVHPTIIAFPMLGTHTGMTKAIPREALANIIKWSHWVLYEPYHAQEHLDVLGALAAQSRCFQLTLGPDLFTNPRLLEDSVQ